MSDSQIRVTFQPTGRTVHVLVGTTVLEAAARAGLTIDTPCGGAGTCGKCRVRISQGATEPGEQDKASLSGPDIAAGWRLACQTHLAAPAVIELPESALFGQQQIFTETRAGGEEIDPAIRKIYVQLDPPTLDDTRADLARLEQSVGPVRVNLTVLASLAGLLRDNDFRGTAVLTAGRLVDFEPGDTTDACYGVAFDVGTTTLVGSLVHLPTGKELAVAARMNPQVRYGDDVLSRIKYAGETEGGNEQLRHAVLEALNEIIAELAEQAGMPNGRFCEAAFAGNTTMQHLLCGLDVEPLGRVPFAATCSRGLVLESGELGIDIHPRGGVYVFPTIGGFVGGDIVAGLLATEIDKQTGPTLLVDIGTNGEIVLSHDGKLWAASTAAGPAFEGARISCGMRAARGAIEKVVLNDELRISTIGDAPPVGICGSALVDLAAELLRKGMLSPEGRLLTGDELPAELPPALARCAVTGPDGQGAFRLTAADAQPAVVLTQRDIREMQLATGAIRAGVILLLRQAGLEVTDVEKVFIAGGFGSFIRRSHAQRIGLLPPEIPHDRISYVGNASLNGARWALLSRKVRQHAEQLARETEHLELAQDPAFQMEFAEAMIFPG
jgi:uncharacterized 2Fe-2S/4Fe-4S cluster protein (DUF4445 family)